MDFRNGFSAADHAVGKKRLAIGDIDYAGGVMSDVRSRYGATRVETFRSHVDKR